MPPFKAAGAVQVTASELSARAAASDCGAEAKPVRITELVDQALTEPARFVAVSFTRKYLPASAVTGV